MKQPDSIKGKEWSIEKQGKHKENVRLSSREFYDVMLGYFRLNRDQRQIGAYSI